MINIKKVKADAIKPKKYVSEFPFTKEEVFGKIKFDLDSSNIEEFFFKKIVEYIKRDVDFPIDFIKEYVSKNTYLKFDYISLTNEYMFATLYCKFNNKTYISPSFVFDKDDILIVFVKENNGKWSKEFIKPKDIYNKIDVFTGKIFKIKYQNRRK